MERDTKPGSAIVYTDETGNKHNAVVTSWWGGTSCNLVFVSDDEAKRDPYGQQIERRTSTPHRSKQEAPGNFWQWPDEVA